MHRFEAGCEGTHQGRDASAWHDQHTNLSRRILDRYNSLRCDYEAERASLPSLRGWLVLQCCDKLAPLDKTADYGSECLGFYEPREEISSLYSQYCGNVIWRSRLRSSNRQRRDGGHGDLDSRGSPFGSATRSTAATWGRGNRGNSASRVMRRDILQSRDSGNLGSLTF